MPKKTSDKNAQYEVSLKILLRNKKGEALLLRMPDTSSMAGYYDLVGGRIRETEKMGSFRKILDREIKEEIGAKAKYEINEVPVAIGRHSYLSKIYKEERYIFWVLFEAKYKGGDIKLSEEHKEYEWISLNKKNFRKLFIRGPLEVIGNYLFGKLTAAK